MTAVLSVVLGFLANLFGQWLNRTPAVVPIAKEAGAAEQSTADTQAALKTETAIANAEAQAPVSVQGVEDRLNQGTF